MNVATYPVFNMHQNHIGFASTATKAAEMLFVDAMAWDQSDKPLNATFCNVEGKFAWSDSRLPTVSLVPLLKLIKH